MKSKENNEEEWYVFKKTYSDEIFFRANTVWPLRIFKENALDLEQLLEDGYIELLPNKNEDENDIESVTLLTKTQSDFLRDHKNIKELVARTGDAARAEIAGDLNKFIIYLKDGVLMKEDGLGNVTQYVKSELYLQMETLKDELKVAIIKSDAPFELQQRLIKVVEKTIEEYVEEKEEDNETGQ